MRYVIAILAVLAIVFLLGGTKFLEIQKLIAFGQQMGKAGPPPETVGTSVAKDQQWEGTLTATGSVNPARGVTVANEIAGTVTSLKFDSGDMVKAGQVLVELDTSVERANLASAIARRELANTNAQRSRDLIKSGAVPRMQLDQDEQAYKGAIADAAGLQATIERKTVRAPFAGKVGIRQVNLGQYLTPGTALTVLQASDALYVDFTLPQQALGDLKAGMPIRITLEGAKDQIDGKIAAIDPTLDSSSRTIKVRGGVEGKNDKLRVGMFVQVQVVLPPRPAQVTLPASAIIHASYGDSIYIVEDRKDDKGQPVNGPDGKPQKAARQAFVKVGEARGDFVSILDGVKNGDEVVTAGAFKLRNNAPVVVNNEVKQNPQLNPTPANH